VHTDEPAVMEFLQKYQAIIMNLARLDSFSVSQAGPKPVKSATALLEQASIYVPLEGVVDFNAEARRLEKEMRKINTELKTVTSKLENKNFMTKAPEQIVSQVEIKQKNLLEREAKLKSNIERIKEFIA